MDTVWLPVTGGLGAFESIILSVQSGRFNVGMSSVTDTAEREQAVDFVTYFEAGTLSLNPWISDFVPSRG